jgi:hypothetical protein
MLTIESPPTVVVIGGSGRLSPVESVKGRDWACRDMQIVRFRVYSCPYIGKIAREPVRSTTSSGLTGSDLSLLHPDRKIWTRRPSEIVR